MCSSDSKKGGQFFRHSDETRRDTPLLMLQSTSSDQRGRGGIKVIQIIAGKTREEDECEK